MDVLEKILEEIEERRGSYSRYSKSKIGKKSEKEILERITELGYVEEIIRSHMGEMENDGWIPVEERLPEEGTYVMCCFDDGAVDVLWQNWQEDKSLLFYADIDNEIRKAIAWQPLPEPYKDGRER